MKLGPGRDPAGQLGFKVHVDVLEFGFPREHSSGDFLADLIEPAQDALELRSREQADFLEHSRMGL